MAACPQCTHDLAKHNDAGSEPIGGFLPGKSAAFISAGEMCCYARPVEGEPGREQWGNTVCGCSFSGSGTRRWY